MISSAPSPASMTVAAAARHLGLLWVAVEATTVASAPMIYFNHNRYSIEATWKYLLFCSVGIALAMLGILFLAYAGLHGGAVHDRPGRHRVGDFPLRRKLPVMHLRRLQPRE